MTDAEEELAELKNTLQTLQGELEEARSMAAFWEYQMQGAVPSVDAMVELKRFFGMSGNVIPTAEILAAVRELKEDRDLWKLQTDLCGTSVDVVREMQKLLLPKLGTSLDHPFKVLEAVKALKEKSTPSLIPSCDP